MSGAYGIGSTNWEGLAKVIEECGELVQVAGKLIAANGQADHWDGSDLHARVAEEVGDVLAAVQFLVESNDIDERAVSERRDKKLKLYSKWHKEQLGHRMGPQDRGVQHPTGREALAIKPCPSCGESGGLTLEHPLGFGTARLSQMICECGLAGPTSLSAKGAISKWNMIFMGTTRANAQCASGGKGPS